MLRVLGIEEFFKEKTGITERNPIKRRRKEKELRENCEKWKDIHKEYQELLELYEQQEKAWNKTSEWLLERTGEKMPEIRDITVKVSIEPETSFWEIWNSIQEVKNLEREREEKCYEIENEAIKKYWTELVEEAEKRGAKLIVLKDPEYQVEEESRRQKFEEAVEKKEAARISFMGICQWLAIPTNDWLGDLYIRNSTINIRKVEPEFY